MVRVYEIEGATLNFPTLEDGIDEASVCPYRRLVDSSENSVQDAELINAVEHAISRGIYKTHSLQQGQRRTLTSPTPGLYGIDLLLPTPNDVSEEETCSIPIIMVTNKSPESDEPQDVEYMTIESEAEYFALGTPFHYKDIREFSVRRVLVWRPEEIEQAEAFSPQSSPDLVRT